LRCQGHVLLPEILSTVQVSHKHHSVLDFIEISTVKVGGLIIPRGDWISVIDAFINMWKSEMKIMLLFIADPKPCAAHTCRMLCPHGFALDDAGCPRCQCHDPCSEVQCPNALSCELEEVACSKHPCPPVPRCEYGQGSSGCILVTKFSSFYRGKNLIFPVPVAVQSKA